MTITVTDDFTQIHSLDNTTNVISDSNIIAMTGTADTSFFVQGTASNSAQFKAATLGGVGVDMTSANNWLNRHVMIWFNNLDVLDTQANHGCGVMISTDVNLATNYGYIDAGGVDTRKVFVQRFMFICADANRPFDGIAGTRPNITSAQYIALSIKCTTASGQNTFFLDEMKYGTKITIMGGATEVAAASSTDIVEDATTGDEADGRGVFKKANGTFFICCGVDFGDGTTTSNYFRDAGEVWVIEDLPVSNTHNTFTFNGNATGTHSHEFGTASGTGVNKEASGGNSFLSAGDVPFQIECTDANADPKFYGCTITGPAAMRADPLRNFLRKDATGPTYTDTTQNANDPGTTAALLFPASEATGDAAMFGSDRVFSELVLDLATAAAGTYTLVWEYSKGTDTWGTIPNSTDGTSNLTVDGTVSFSVPDDWATDTFSSTTRYWLRCRLATGSFTTNPTLNQAEVKQGVNVRLETATTEAIRTTFSQTETIRVRNGAFVKKCVITNSNANSVNAALDLGGSDPASNSVRDLTISNCSKGILLRGTGNVTFNFRNIKFSNNTSDIRVDFGAGDTITINLLEDSDNPTIDNVNGSTVSKVVEPVALTLNVDDNVGDDLQNARVMAEAGDSTGPMPFMENVTITRSVSTATVAHTNHDLTSGDSVVIRGADQQEYNGVFAVSNISTNAYDYTVTGTPATPATGNRVKTGEDETSYDNTPTTEGTFSGGTGHAATDVITLDKGVLATVDAVSVGVVTQFTVDSTASIGGVTAGDVLSQVSTTGAGVDFSLTPDSGNLGISATGCILSALTDVNGQATRSRSYTSNQPIRGYVRKSTSSPRFKSRDLDGNTVDKAAGLTISMRLVLDE